MGFLRGIVTALLTASVSLRDCGNPVNDQAVITGFGFSPSIPTAGAPTELWVAYDLKSELTGGTATYTYKINGLPFSPTVEDLCSQTSCPKSAGPQNETSHSTFPSGITGKIVTQIQWKNTTNQPVWCLETTFNI
jgi:hypothetical protein